MNQQGHKHEQNNKAQTKIILSEQDMLVKRPGIRHASWETKHELRHKMIDEMRIVAKRNEIIIIIYYYFIQFIGIVYALRRVAHVSRCCFRLSYVPAIFVSEHTQRMVGSWVYQSILNVISNLIRFQHLMANSVYKYIFLSSFSAKLQTMRLATSVDSRFRYIDFMLLLARERDRIDSIFFFSALVSSIHSHSMNAYVDY